MKAGKKHSSLVHKISLHKKIFFPFIAFLLVSGILFFSTRFVEKMPVVLTINPSVASPGDTVVITGSFFNDRRNGGMVTLTGSRIVSESYKVWSDTRIEFIVPEDAGSGMVRVITRKGRSNGVLFTNRNHIPVVLSGPAAPGLPHIESIEPSQGGVGTLVTVKGLNFGFDRGQSRVFFTQAPLGDAVRFDDAEETMISCSELDYDYESWTDQEIQFYVPDGASSGSMRVSVDRGESNSKYFEVKNPAGGKLFTQRKGYQLTYEVNIFSPRGTPQGSLDIWFPGLLTGQEQRSVESLREPEPLWADFSGVQRYHYEGITGMGDQKISQTYWFERYAVETRILVPQIPQKYNTGRDLYKVYTAPDLLVNPQEAGIPEKALELTRRQNNPYLKAKILYDHVLKTLSYNASPVSINPAKALEQGQGDAYIYAVAFCALTRSAGIPSRPVAGYLVYNDKITVRHFWAEFYIEGFGWIPVDPALGDGVRFGNFPAGLEKPEEFYFGNLDNQHITFSRGVIQIKPILPDGVPVTRDRMFSLQTIHEESSGLESYDTLWGDVQVVDWW